MQVWYPRFLLLLSNIQDLKVFLTQLSANHVRTSGADRKIPSQKRKIVGFDWRSDDLTLFFFAFDSQGGTVSPGKRSNNGYCQLLTGKHQSCYMVGMFQFIRTGFRIRHISFLGSPTLEEGTKRIWYRDWNKISDPKRLLSEMWS